jgi:hypothetical protein
MNERTRWRIWHWLCKLPNVCPAQAHSYWPSRSLALAKEDEAIVEELPLYNIAGHPHYVQRPRAHV